MIVPRLDLQNKPSPSQNQQQLVANNQLQSNTSSQTPNIEITITQAHTSPKQPTSGSNNSNRSRSNSNHTSLSAGGRSEQINLAKRSLRLADDFEQQSKYLFQVNEKGFVVSVAASILMEFQQYIEKEFVENSKFIPQQVLNDVKEKKREDVKFNILFQFRSSDTYLKHLRLFRETAFEKNCQLYCQLILDWLQQPSGTSDVGVPEWSYTKFRNRILQQLMLNGDERNNVMVQSLDILIWLSASDVLCTVLKHYNKLVVDSHITEGILRSFVLKLL